MRKKNDNQLKTKSESLSKCIFCRIIHDKNQSELIGKFKYCYAIKDNNPVSKGHSLIIPYEHIEDWFTAREEVCLDMMEALYQVKVGLDAEYQPDGYNIGINCGVTAGQSIMHLHMHLIPRYEGDMSDPKGGVRGVIPFKQKY